MSPPSFTADESFAVSFAVPFAICFHWFRLGVEGANWVFCDLVLGGDAGPSDRERTSQRGELSALTPFDWFGWPLGQPFHTVRPFVVPQHPPFPRAAASADLRRGVVSRVLLE